ncbi:MAG: HAMP domain-containing sensor histidine kinase [Patescibacteria group bacterium]
MADTDEKEVISSVEYKKVTEEMYKQNLELARLYKEVDSLNAELSVANEKLKSLDKLKTEFLSFASHQLRSPITAIKGYSSMLLEGSYGDISDTQKSSIDKIFKSSNRMNHMIVRFLDVAKIEQGGMQYVMTQVDLEVIAKELTNELSVVAKEKGLTLSFENDKKSPYLVSGDREQLWQVVQNLIDNSIKYTKTGWIKVILSKDEESKKVILKVSDSGMGVKAEILPTLFEKFSRGDGGQMNVEGSGIGLYLAKHVIEDHKGKIWIESSGAGQGSTFYIELDAI